MRTPCRSLTRAVPYLIPVALTFAACGGDELPSTGDHTPVTYQVLVDNVAVSAPYTLASDEMARVRIKFFNRAQDDLDDVESEHFAGLAFNPTTLATVARVSDHNYQFDVTGQTPGTGTVRVGFGHDNLANEVSFPPVAVTVTGTGAPKE
jgi:hypothetical protein